MTHFRPEIEAMSGYTPGEQPGGGKYIKLNTNENPYPPPPTVNSAIAEAAETLTRYPDPLATTFRLAASEVLGVEPEWILCGNGSDDLLTIVTRAFVNSGQRMRLPYPSYVLYKTLARLQGAQWEESPFDKQWKPGPDFAAATPGLKLAFSPNPNSPTGTMVDVETIDRLAAQMPCPLVVDEAYVDFAKEHCLSLVARHENLLVTRSLSKSYALAGLRFGYLVAQPQVVQQLRKVKDSYNCDSLSIAAAAAAIADQDWLRENRARVVASRQRLQEQLRQLGFDVIPSQANFVWCEHPTASAESLYLQLKQQGVLVRYMNYDRWREGLRISVGTDEQLEACLSLLAAMV